MQSFTDWARTTGFDDGQEALAAWVRDWAPAVLGTVRAKTALSDHEGGAVTAFRLGLRLPVFEAGGELHELAAVTQPIAPPQNRFEASGLSFRAEVQHDGLLVVIAGLRIGMDQKHAERLYALANALNSEERLLRLNFTLREGVLHPAISAATYCAGRPDIVHRLVLSVLSAVYLNWDLLHHRIDQRLRA